MGATINSSLAALRLINVVATWLLSGGVFLIASRILRTDYWTSVLLALTITLSPYIFGTSFILLTDNLAMLFAVVALYCTLRYMESRDAEFLMLGVPFAAAAILTRQLYLWLLPVTLAAWVLSLRRGASRNPLGVLALLLLAAAPYALLAVLWGGTNPPQYQTFQRLNPRSIGFLVSCIGAYGGPFLIAALPQPLWWRRFGSGWFLLLIASATVVTLRAAPLHYIPFDANCAWQQAQSQCSQTDGFLWNVSSKLPNLFDSSLLFWFLIPLGFATIFYAWWPSGQSVQHPTHIYAMPPVIAICFGALSIANASPFQKHFDFVALLVCMLIIFRSGHYRPIAARIVLCGFGVLFAAYAAKPLIWL